MVTCCEIRGLQVPLLLAVPVRPVRPVLQLHDDGDGVQKSSDSTTSKYRRRDAKREGRVRLFLISEERPEGYSAGYPNEDEDDERRELRLELEPGERSESEKA
jgi:hypothetical protein